MRLFFNIFLWLLMIVCGLYLNTGFVNAQEQKNDTVLPNVIIFFTDDHGTMDVNVYGADDLYTPNMDALAERGVRFTQFYAAAASCTPSRAALLTGRYPLRTGLPTNTESHPTQFGKGKSLNPDEVTIAHMLKAAGYRTAQLGKWHLGTTRGPNEQGFDYSFGFLGGVIDQWSHFNYGRGAWGSPPRWHDLHRNGEEVWKAGVHIGDLMVQEAIDFIEKDEEDPFFIYFATGLPHYPLHPYNHYMEYYSDLSEPRRSYAASVSTIDEQIGQILEKVKELAIQEKTLIIFQSDHGHSTQDRTNFGGGNAGSYRGSKNSYFEGGIRVPAIVSMPGTLPEGVVRNQLAHGTDWLPTIAEVAGIELLQKDIDGLSLLPIIMTEDTPAQHDVIHWYDGRGGEGQWAIRQGPWKLIGNPRERDKTGTKKIVNRLFLSNLEKDETEMKNFVEQYPKVVNRLKRLHFEWKWKVEKQLLEANEW